MRAGVALACALLTVTPAPAASTPAGPKVTATSAIIVDAQTGEIIWSRNPDKRLPPASTTKVMTAIVAAESAELDRRVPVSAYASTTAPSKLWLKPGQSMAVRDLLYAVLLKSANDAAVVVAEGVAGSVPAFSRQMNAKARSIGASSSSFSNPHGLTQEGHLSTAADLARIFRHAMDSPLLREVLTTKSIRVPIYSKKMHTVAVHSHNRLLSGYDHQVIGKTGYTRAAKRCFVGAAKGDDGREVIIALLGSNSLWPDAKALVEYGLDNIDTPRRSPQMQPRTAPPAQPAQRPAPPTQMVYLDTGEPVRPSVKEAVVREEPTSPPPRRFDVELTEDETVPPSRTRAATPAPSVPEAKRDPEPARRPAAPVEPPAAVARAATPPPAPTRKSVAAKPAPTRAPEPIAMGDAPEPIATDDAPEPKQKAKPTVQLAMRDETPSQAANSAGASRWAVELGPFDSKNRAESTRRGLADLGYGAELDGRTIRLGSFSSRSRADRLADRLRLSGYRPTIVALR